MAESKEMRGGALLLLAVVAAGCASVVPSELAPVVNRSISGADLVRDPERYRGATVVVGGEILHVQNNPADTELEVLERPLTFEEPMLNEPSAGRFLVRAGGFLDPAVHEVGRRVTVVGTVAGAVVRKIGAADYRYPVLDNRRLKLWPFDAPWRGYGYPPYWHDPFWGPFWFYDPVWSPYWYWYRARPFGR
jgi:outer membrane lipoprotein